ncbi:MAG: DUF120 domain-containing protein [Candidatus Micrarchaeota archaeon]
MRLRGRVVPGFGEGKKFFSIGQYLAEFEKILGKKPFSGTLNLDVGKENIGQVEMAERDARVCVEGFEIGGKKYGEVKCVRAKITFDGGKRQEGKNAQGRVMGVEGFLVFPEINKHPKNIVEFACSENLREKFGLKDGNWAEIRILPDI